MSIIPSRRFVFGGGPCKHNTKYSKTLQQCLAAPRHCGHRAKNCRVFGWPPSLRSPHIKVQCLTAPVTAVTVPKIALFDCAAVPAVTVSYFLRCVCTLRYIDIIRRYPCLQYSLQTQSQRKYIISINSVDSTYRVYGGSL